MSLISLANQEPYEDPGFAAWAGIGIGFTGLGIQISGTRDFTRAMELYNRHVMAGRSQRR
jgi:hypothetical protein